MTRFAAPRFTARSTTSFSQHAAAFVFALATTLAMLSGVDTLATPSSAGALLVQTDAAHTQG